MASTTPRVLSSFLKKYFTKENHNITHTRIGDPNAKPPIKGGKYSIPESQMQAFNTLYYKNVFTQRKAEYLTEKQLKDGTGPIAVDFDFRYSSEIQERQHNQEHIQDMIQLYQATLSELVIIEEGKTFPIWVFEKPNVNCQSSEYTKDGIHMIIGIQADHTLQQML